MGTGRWDGEIFLCETVLCGMQLLPPVNIAAPASRLLRVCLFLSFRVLTSNPRQELQAVCKLLSDKRRIQVCFSSHQAHIERSCVHLCHAVCILRSWLVSQTLTKVAIPRLTENAHLPMQLNPEELFAVMDLDGSGEIDIGEFVQLMTVKDTSRKQTHSLPHVHPE